MSLWVSYYKNPHKLMKLCNVLKLARQDCTGIVIADRSRVSNIWNPDMIITIKVVMIKD